MEAFDGVCAAVGPAACTPVVEQLCSVVEALQPGPGGPGNASMPSEQAQVTLLFATHAARRVLPDCAVKSVLPLLSKLVRHSDFNIRQVSFGTAGKECDFVYG